MPSELPGFLHGEKGKVFLKRKSSPAKSCAVTIILMPGGTLEPDALSPYCEQALGSERAYEIIAPGSMPAAEASAKENVNHIPIGKRNLSIYLNQAVRHAQGEALLLLNSEAPISANCLTRMLDYLQSDSAAGMAGPRLFETERSVFLPASYDVAHHKIGISSEQLPFYKNKDAYGPERQVNYLNGDCLLIRRSVFNETGLFDERLPDHLAIIDLCLRADANGWKLTFLADCSVCVASEHTRRWRSGNRLIPRRLSRWWHRLYFYQKHGFAMPTESQAHAVIVPRKFELASLLATDAIAVLLAFYFWSIVRGMLGVFTVQEPLELALISAVMLGFWSLVFQLFGLYRPWRAYSRFDEILTIFKAVTIGVGLIFLVTMDPSDLRDPLKPSRLLIISYWIITFLGLALGRSVLRTVQRRLLSAGFGLSRTLIIGWNKPARALYDKVKRFSALGFRVVGFVSEKAPKERENHDGIPVLGKLDALDSLIKSQRIETVLIALSQRKQQQVMDVIARCADLEVTIKIIPDLYSIMMGRARTNQIYGTTLLEVLPQHMPVWEQQMKRILDVLASMLVLVLGSPLWLALALWIKLDSGGPVFYAQERVGRRGQPFKMHKFRTMVADAEKLTGPKWAEEHDPRITRIGRWLRGLRLDEVPQFWNVLKGEMSLVGPRPERPFFVQKLRKEIPLYSRRLRVRPGITGWAQVKGSYDGSVDDVWQKLQYDLFYLENMSLRMDFKIMVMTVYVVLSQRGQ